MEALTAVVFGMPKEAIALDAVDEVAPLSRLASLICRSKSLVASA